MELKLVVAIVMIVLLSVLLYFSEESETTLESFGIPPESGRENISKEELERQLECLLENTILETIDVWGESAIKVPAVDENGNGVVTWLTVDVMPGEGRTLTDINQLLFWVDTQYSIQIAKSVAANHTKMNISNLDILYAIDTEATLVEGPSAGAALTVATVAALYNETLDSETMITGTINPDGSIGPVGGVLEKATAAKDIGATVFLVPKGQSVQVTYTPMRVCERMGPFTYCRTNYVQERTDIEEEAGIEIKEVSNIAEALKYFL